MIVQIKLADIQHVKEIQFSFNLEETGLICIAGKNGVGKTTLVKAIRNLINADTFTKTSSDEIFSSSSSIIYELDGREIIFKYDHAIKNLNCKEQIPDDIRSKIAVELPIPHGERFNFFQRISNADPDIRKSIILDQYISPHELIEFLHDIYANTKFEKLVEISIRNAKYYCVLLPSGKYLREDYLSSGEYFLISVYRRITQGCRLIVIDEIDISLDAAAQVRLVKKLREFGKKYHVGFVFTTHSLAMMRTLQPDELFYMDQDSSTGIVTITNVSYNYVKSILFGFTGWDKYILTEDDVLKDFLEHIIRRFCKDVFYQYKIIFIGGGTNTTDLMRRNSDERFLTEPDNVITVLDGDQYHLRHSKRTNVFCIPINSVEKGLLVDCLSGDFDDRIKISEIIDDAKELSEYLMQSTIAQGQSQPRVEEPPKHKHRSLQFFYGFVKTVRIFDLIKRFIQRLTHKKPTPQCHQKDIKEKDFNNAAKKVFRHLLSNKIVSKNQIFEHLCNKHEVEIARFSTTLRNFLTQPIK